MKRLATATCAVSALAIGAVAWSMVCLGGPAVPAATVTTATTQTSSLVERVQIINANQTVTATAEPIIIERTVYKTDEPAEVVQLARVAYEVDAQGAEPEPEPETAGAGTQVIDGWATYYDVCLSCCGKSDGVTASGLTIYNGMDDPHIVACNWLDLGTVIKIDGVTYTVADRGGSSLDTVGRLDIYTPEGHAAALVNGSHAVTIEIMES